MTHVDVYMFPCVTSCGYSTAASQMQDFISQLSSNGVQFGTLWLDIEIYDWFSDQGQNQGFFNALVGAAGGQQLGVYTSQNNWCTIMGCSFSGGSSLPLWYADWDGIPDFSDFSPYGGWSSPSMKQFADDGSFCGVSYDIDWYPPGAFLPFRKA